MAYAAISKEPQYADADDTLGGTSRPKQDHVVELGLRGVTGIEENVYRIEAQAAEKRRQEELAAARAAQLAQRENAPADGEAPKPEDPQQSAPQKVARANGPAGVSPALKGPPGPPMIA